MKLIRAWSIIKEFDGYANVPIFWYHPKREIPIFAYNELIKDYDQNDPLSLYPEGFADEFYTESEIEELKRVLNKFREFRNPIVNVIIVDIPFPNNSYPLGGIPSDSRHGSIVFSQDVTLDLGFQLCGYYDIRPFIHKDSKTDNVSNFSNTPICDINESPDYEDFEDIEDIPF
ncbi:hypothetical protein [Desulfosporosinus shakirovi]|uniref:hypothetical protein n=1 Tax=Desulfosporosinus shakirovi TaxID=2885154 RepID=UPI001E2D576C|nr:hypothetical protein [Desulfosporosinus sp. SRJS8]MCB8817377.1 hypothetical protein [Desulfosporosinus sp. SRJS8]